MNHEVYEHSALAPRIYEYILAGLLLAGSAAAATGYHVYHGFITETISRDQAYWGIGLPSIGVAAGIYIFAYGWQRGDIEKAIRMSMWLSLGAVGIIVAVLGALAFKRSDARSVWGFGAPRRQRRSGWQFGDSEDNYEYSVFGGTLFGGDGDRAPEKGPDVLTVHCRNCGDMFVPQPPKALCPSCGASALGRTG